MQPSNTVRLVAICFGLLTLLAPFMEPSPLYCALMEIECVNASILLLVLAQLMDLMPPSSNGALA